MDEPSPGTPVPKPMISRLYPKLGLWIGAVSLCMILALWLVTIQMVENDLDDEVRSIVKIQSNMAKAMEAHVLDILDDADHMLLFIKDAYEKDGGISSVTRRVLESSLHSKFAVQLGVLDANGNFRFSLRPALPGVNLADRPYFQAHISRDTGTAFIGSVVLGRVSGRSSFHMSRRINNDDGSFGGVASLAIGTDYFAAAFNRMTLEKMYFVLIGRDGIVRGVDEKSAVLLGRDLSGGTLLRALERGPQNGDYLDRVIYLDVRRFVSYRALRDYPLVVAISVDEDAALQRFYERRKLYYGMAGLISIIFIVITTVLRHMLQRQERLGLTILAEKERAEHYLDVAGSMILALDLEGRVTLLNRRGCEILGYETEELLGKDWFDTIIPPESRTYVRSKFKSLISEKTPIRRTVSDMGVLTRDGGRRMISWTNNLLRNSQGKVIGTISSGIDVTERRQLEAQLLQLATTDSLTGLNNRRSFLEKGRRDFEVFRRYQRPLSLLMIDIDCFKRINDRFGHAAGDLVLVRLAEVCGRILRSVDLIGRFGGEEFICMLPETSSEKAHIEAERLRQALAEEVVLTENGEINFTVSIGVSSANPDDTSIEELIHRADTAMYVAKRAGRNRVVAAG